MGSIGQSLDKVFTGVPALFLQCHSFLPCGTQAWPVKCEWSEMCHFQADALGASMYFGTVHFLSAPALTMLRGAAAPPAWVSECRRSQGMA